MEEIKRRLKPSERKILRGIMHLKELGLEPTMDGLANYLNGNLNEGTYPLRDDEGFSSLAKSPKKIKNKINLLVRYGYIRLAYDEELDERFLYLGEKGIEEARKTSLKSNKTKEVIHFRKIK